MIRRTRQNWHHETSFDFWIKHRILSWSPEHVYEVRDPKSQVVWVLVSTRRTSLHNPPKWWLEGHHKTEHHETSFEIWGMNRLLSWSPGHVDEVRDPKYQSRVSTRLTTTRRSSLHNPPKWWLEGQHKTEHHETSFENLRKHIMIPWSSKTSRWG